MIFVRGAAIGLKDGDIVVWPSRVWPEPHVDGVDNILPVSECTSWQSNA